MSDTAKKLCSACHTELELASAAFPMGSAFAHERFHVDLYRCPSCGRVELFATEQNEQEMLVTCPVCGATHSPKEKCPICAINAAFSDHEAQ